MLFAAEQTAVLPYLDAHAGQALGYLVVPYPRLEPDRLRPSEKSSVFANRQVYGTSSAADMPYESLRELRVAGNPIAKSTAAKSNAPTTIQALVNQLAAGHQ